MGIQIYSAPTASGAASGWQVGTSPIDATGSFRWEWSAYVGGNRYSGTADDEHAAERAARDALARLKREVA